MTQTRILKKHMADDLGDDANVYGDEQRKQKELVDKLMIVQA